MIIRFIIYYILAAAIILFAYMSAPNGLSM